MAEDTYGTLFPENIGPLFTGELPGQNPVLTRLGRLYDSTAQMQKPQAPINEVGPSYIPTTTDDDRDLYDLYKPVTKYTDEYEALIKNMPKRTSPGVGTRILAGLSTLGQGGLKQAENVKYSQFNRDMVDWTERANRLKDLAEMERYQNTNNRMILNSALTERRSDRRQTEVERKNAAAEGDRAKRTALMQFKADNPDSKFIRLGNGNWGYADPQNNNIVDSGVKYGLSPLEDILMERESTRERQATAAQHAQELEGLRQQNRIELERLQAMLKQLMEGNKALTPEQEKVRQFLVAQEVSNTNDPEVKKFLTVNEAGANTFTVKMPNTLPGWTSWGAEQKRRNAQIWIDINKKIYGPAWQPPKSIQDIANPPGAKPAAQATPSTRPANVPANYIKVKKGNQVGWIDPKQFDAKTMQRVP